MVFNDLEPAHCSTRLILRRSDLLPTAVGVGCERYVHEVLWSIFTPWYQRARVVVTRFAKPALQTRLAHTYTASPRPRATSMMLE